MLHRFKTALLVLVCLILTVSVFAQTSQTSGEIQGRVTDGGGDALPGVTVTAVNENTGFARTVYTDSDGRYVVALVPPGTYRVTAELAGLGQETRTGVVVRLGVASNVRLTLNPQLAEEIVVTAEAPVVDVSSADVASSVTDEQIQNLPILGRDFKDLVLLTPGVTEAFGDRISLNGGRGITTDYNIDGAEANSEFFGEERGGTEAPFVFSQAAIKEFQVIRSSYSAEYNKGVGGTMNAITKSGTNEIEGQAFWYMRDADWADERSAVLGGRTVDEFFEARDSDQYGFALGGPIVRDTFHYFINADLQDITEPVSVRDFRTSDEFLELDPATQQALTSRISELLPWGFDQEFNFVSQDDQETYLVKLDFNAAQNHHLSLRHNYSDYNNFPSEGNNPLSNQGEEFNTVNSTVFQAESVFGPQLFNQVIVQFGVEERPINALVMGVPDTNIFDLRYQFGRLEFLPNGTDEEKWQFKDKVSYFYGDHYFKAGFEYMDTHIDNFFPREAGGEYNFDTVEDFLANEPSGFAQGFGPTNGRNVFDLSSWGAFLHDTWSASDRLTLDLGVRYDLQDIPQPEQNAFPERPEFADWNNDDDNFAPRFGFAYDVMGDGRSVVRGGAGKFFNPIPAILYAGPTAEVAGTYNRISLRCSSDDCPTYPNIISPEDFGQFVRSASDITILSPDLEAQESTRFSLGYEQQLGQSYSVSLEGVYADLTNQQRLVNVNASPTGIVYGNLPVYRSGTDDSMFPEFRDVKMHVSDAEGTYKSVTLGTRKFAFGDSRFTWLAHYTWAEAIDQDSNERSTSSSRSYDPFNPELSEGRADYDVTHRAVLSGTYELPFGILASGIYRWNSGQPYTAEIFAGRSGLNGLFQVAVNTPVF
ncbi:MAG: TonB-dependent receptor, partial [Acidobacteria bacterium]|nr:TonB-dependent receptor [Acidobacteriota bacterium]